MCGEIFAKVKAIEQLVGSNIMNWYRTPPRKKLRIMSTQARLHIDRAKKLHTNRLAAREAHR